MPRKKKAVTAAHAPDTSFNPAEFDPAMKAAAEGPAPTLTALSEPGQHAAEREAAHQHGHALANENGHASRHSPHRSEGQSHAQAVGKRPERVAGYTPGFKDQLAGAHRLEHHNPYLSVIRFDEKPSDAVRQFLGDNHFTWSQENKEWKRPIRFETRQQDREDARRVFDEVCQMVRAERGITHNYGGVA